MPQPEPNVRAEVRIARAVAPRCYRLWRLRRWHWGVTKWRAVSDREREHLWADSGHTFFRWQAALAAARVVAEISAEARGAMYAGVASMEDRRRGR